MPGYLRQATASQSRALGPFLDSTDFLTAKTALTIANTDIKLVVNGAASANKNSGGGTHRVNGVYGVTFDATDSATVGEIEVSVVVAGALPVFDKFFVVEEAVFDALFAASAAGYQVPIWAAANSSVSLSGTTVATVTTLTGHTAQTGDAYAVVNNGTHGNAAIKGYVDDIGTAGAGLTAVPWNAAWDAEVQSEAEDALAAVGVTTTVTARIDAAVTTRATPAQVNTEVLDCLVTDTHAELSAVPAATSSLKDKLNWLFALARNKLTQTSTTQTLRNDADSGSIGTATVGDDGTTASRGEWS